jgi:hypothetical protein
MVRATIALAATLLLAAGAAHAQQQLGVGFYTPELPIDPYQRFGYAQGLAQHLSKALGVPVSGFAYKTAGDLRRDLAAKKIQLAVLGGFYLASHPQAKHLASSVLSTRRQLSWTLMAKRVAPLLSLKGRTLQLPSLGPLVHGLVQNGLLGGNLEIRTHFRIVESPDLTSAVEAVRLDQAQAVFAPVDAKGLRPLIPPTVQVAAPAFVQLDANLDAALVKKAAAAVLGFKAAAGALAGWSAAGAGDYGRFAALARRKLPRMEMVAMPGDRLQHGDIVDARVVRYELPGFDEHFQVP